MKKTIRGVILLCLMAMMVFYMASCDELDFSLRNAGAIRCLRQHDYVNSICTVCGKSQYLILKLSSDGSSYSVSGVREPCPSTVIIPSTYLGKPVTRINDSVFKNRKTLKNITIPNTITTIGDLPSVVALALQA